MTWCHVPETDCPSAQEAADWIWASCSQSQDSTADALLSGSRTPEMSSSPRSAPDTLPQHQSGMTLQHLTQDPSPEQSTRSSADTPARAKALLASGLEKTTSGGSGMTSPGSSKSLGPHSVGASLKTSSDTSHPVLRPCCEAFETWASRLRLAYSQRKKSARRMKGNASSSWPTAKALTGGANSKREQRGAGGPDLQEAAENWPTPTPMETRDGWTEQDLTRARDQIKATGINGNGFGLGLGAAAGVAMENWQTPRTVAGGYTRDGGQKGEERLSLQGQAETLNWGTPRASDAEKGSPNQSFGAGGIPLPAQAAKWPTPMAGTPAQNGNNAAGNNDFSRKADILAAEVLHRSLSHPAPQIVTDGLPPSQWRPTSRRLFRSAISNVSATTLRRWSRKGSWRKRRLNPLFVGWLMGWPPGHALSNCSATEWCHFKQHMRGALSALPTASGPWIWEPPAKTAPEPTQMDMFGGLGE